MNTFSVRKQDRNGVKVRVPGRGVWPHLRYASYVARHKWFVFRAGLKTGAPLWRLIIHDWSKLTRAEWTPYVQSFYGANIDRKTTAQINAEFDAAWLHHQHHNPHHWQYWLTAEGQPMDMPPHFVREMVADWMGAGRAITGKWEVEDWYSKNARRMKLSPLTRSRVEALLGFADSHTFDVSDIVPSHPSSPDQEAR